MSYPRDYVLRYGAAPNPFVNTTLTAAQAMATHWQKLENVKNIFVNTTRTGPVAAEMIPVNEVSPMLRDTPALFYQVQIKGLERTTVDVETGEVVPVDEPVLENYFAVCQWQPIVNSIGLRAATIQYLELIDPNWKEHPEMAAAIEALPTSTYPAPIVTVPPPPPPPPPPHGPEEDTGLASPDWGNWIGNGWLAARKGDTSAARIPDNLTPGTIYSDAIHGRWIKAGEKSMFNKDGGNIHWEMAAGV